MARVFGILFTMADTQLRHILTLLLIVVQLLWMPGVESGNFIIYHHVGINHVFNLSLKAPDWLYSVSHDHSVEGDGCELRFHLINGGELISRGNGDISMGKPCDDRRPTMEVYYLTVNGGNDVLGLNVSFSVVVSVNGSKLFSTIPLVQLNIFHNLADVNKEDINIERLPILRNSLSMFLPDKLINATKPSLIHSSLHDIFGKHWKYNIKDQVVCASTQLNKGYTAFTVNIHNHSVISKSRFKRQIFSNLHSPEFLETSYTVSIREEISLGTEIIQITATDTDEGSAGAVRYSLHADVDQRSLRVFSIDAVNGSVTSTARVNRENITSHRFTVRARDQGSPSNSAQATLTIIVEDINDHAPIFEQSVYNINVSETMTVTSTISRLRAADADTGSNKEIRYSILNSQSVTDFTINHNTGDISIARSLDRENISRYSFVVKAEDQADNVADRLSSTVTANIYVLDYNDNPPEFRSTDYAFHVREDINVSAGPVVIGDVTATDSDYGKNGVIRYSISFGNPFPRVFDIVADTGQLRVIADLDRDRPRGQEYNLRVKANDEGTPVLSSAVSVKVIVVDVNDNAPSFRYPSHMYNVFEDHTVGEPIATIEATDPDEGNNQILAYSIIPPVQGGPLPLSINRNTGVITNNATLDRETVARYEFMVLVQDGGNPRQSATSVVTISVFDRNDNHPEFTQAVYTVLISEDTALQQEVTTVTANDADENDDITYQIVSGNDNDDFVIVKEQKFGVIRVNNALSYDTKRYYSLTVRAVDTSSQSVDCTVQINVTDKNRHTPMFRQDEYTFEIPESSGRGATIGSVQADDSDIERNGQVTYFFVNNGQPLPFMINLTTGEIIVNDTLDRDNPRTQSFQVDVIARDQGLPPLQTEFPAVVYIIIEDVNDNAPVFVQDNYIANISENIRVGSSVITVSAMDADKPGTLNSQVRYTFEGGDSGDGSFYIEESGGTIRVNHSLDREIVSSYDLMVYATDMSMEDRQSSSVMVKVMILDVNDNAPQFESETIIRRILENKPIRSAVEPSIRATDADLGQNAEITYELVGGDIFAFELTDLGDGSFKLYSKVDLDFESLRKNYTLEVQASSEHMITKATIVVKLQDINDNRPELYNFTIIINNYRDHFPNGYIGRVPAFDPDESDRDSLRYTVKSGNEANFFTLNATTGYIKLNKALGSDRPTSGEFVIQVADVLNTVNATCKLVYRLITDDMLRNSVTLRLDDIEATEFMTKTYGYTVQALAVVLGVLPSQIYIIDITDDTEVDTSRNNAVLNVSFAAVQEVDDREEYLNQETIKEEIYRRLDLLKNLSAITILPFDDTLCLLEPCLTYERCSSTLLFDEAAPFITSQTMLFRPIRTKAIHNCECPQGFAGQNISFLCDTEINLCYSNPCQNGGVCRQTEAAFTCLCPTGFKGEHCEYDALQGVFNKSFCPREVCTGQNADCVPLIKGGLACHQDTTRCLETDIRTDTCGVRTASFVPGSYLMFPALDSRARFHIQISFATRKKSGLLLYNGRYNYLHDFISLELVNHTAMFTMSFGDESYTVSVGKQYGLNDGHWHTVDVEYKSWTLTISLDECDVGLALAHPELFDPPCAMRLDISLCRTTASRSRNLCSLDLTGPLLVGGVPEHLTLDKVQLKSSYFVGCIRDLHVNFEPVDLKSAITDHNTQQGCVYKRDFCIHSPCRNQGTCMSSWGTYQCSCPEAKSGRDCSLQAGPSYTFYGLGHLKHTVPSSGSSARVRKPWYNSFVFRTSVDNRPLIRIELEQGKTVEYTLEGGYITFRYDEFYYVFDEALVNDDKWHHFEMRLLANSAGQGQILLQLDYGDIQKGEPLDNGLDGLSVTFVWVGGDRGTNATNRGYAGCMKDMRVGSGLSSETLLSDVVSSQVLNGCNKPTRCEGCDQKTTTCITGYEGRACVCKEGLFGPSCTTVCDASNSPCQNGARCQEDPDTPLGYKCVCSAKYKGIYCEEKVKTQCPAAWWGSPVCGPCNCSAELNFASQCDRDTGHCVCKNGYYKAIGREGCVACSCYYSAGKGGSLGLSCDQRTGQCQCRVGVDGKRCDGCDNPFAEVTGQGCIVQYDSCPKTYVSSVWWTRTKFGVIRIESCPSGSIGNATRICKDNEQGWLTPDLSGCTSLQFLALNRTLVELEVRREDNASQPVHADNTPSYTFLAKNIIGGLRNATEQVNNLYSNDLLLAVKILREILMREKIRKSFDLTNTQDRYFLENLVHITSSILKTTLTDSWRAVTRLYRATALTELVQDFDDYIANLADNMATKFVTIGMDPFQIVTGNMVLGMDSMRSNGAILPKYNNIRKDDSIFDDVTSVELPAGLFTENTNGLLDVKAVSGYILYKTVGNLMASLATAGNNPYSSEISFNSRPQSNLTFGGVILNSPVFSLVLQQGSTKTVLEEPLTITFLLREIHQNNNAQCVYLSEEGRWTDEKCEVVNTTSDRVVCTCLHLSTYALVTDFNSFDVLQTGFGVHMYVAVALALFCLLFTLLIFICLKDLKSNYIYNQINIQMCFCLALIVFIAGSNSSRNQVGCTIVSVLLQFFVLSLFSWMFVNALHLYRILTEKRHIDGEAMFLYVLIGYVGPGIVTGLSVGLSTDAFGTETTCWLDINNTMIWSLAGPVLFCSITIVVLLILAIAVGCQQKPPNTTARKNDSKNFRSAMWVALALTPLTLCTWLFALLTSNYTVYDSKPYDYMFSVFTCVTAVFSLLAHVIFNTRGRGELQRQLKRCQGHGPLEETDSDKAPNVHIAFGDFYNANSSSTFTFGGGSESSTTSNSRLTSGRGNDAPSYMRQGQSSTASTQSPDLLAYLKHRQSLSSSELPTYSQYTDRRGRRRTTSDGSSDSETDSEIRTEREKDIELASSHSSDEDDPITAAAHGNTKVQPLTVHTGPEKHLSPMVADSQLKQHSTPTIEKEAMGFAPPPPYFVTPSAQWSSRLSDSTASTHGTQSRLGVDAIHGSVDRSHSIDRPALPQSFTGETSADIHTRESPTHYQQHTNRSFISSPSTHEMMGSSQLSSPLVPDRSSTTDSRTNSLHRLQRSIDRKKQPAHSASAHHTGSALSANQNKGSLANQIRHSPTTTTHDEGVKEEDIAFADSDSFKTQSSIKSHQDEVFMPPPPDLSLYLSTQPSSGSGSSSLQRGEDCSTLALPAGMDCVFHETEPDLLDDMDNETEV